MTTAYVQEAKQRFTEFGGFSAMEPAGDALAAWADCVLERGEAGLTTLVAVMQVGPEGAVRSVRDELANLADEIARQEKVEVQALLLLVSAEPLTRSAYDRWQELKLNRGAVRLVPWLVDLTREQLFPHQGPPFGIDPDLEILAAPEPRTDKAAEAERPAENSARAVPQRDEYPVPWVTMVLLALIAGIWVIMTVAGGSLNATEDLDLLLNWGAVGRPDMWQQGEYWRMFTAAFLHIGLVHMAMNGLSLWAVGRAVEWLYGPLRMLFIYLGAAVAGSLASAALGPPLILSAGASGAIFGLLGAIVWFRLSSPLGDRIKLRPLLTTLVLNLGISLAMYRVIDNWNHLGGLVGGFVLAAVVGVPAVTGETAPRWRPGRPLRVAGAALAALLLAAFLTGRLVPPGPGRDLAETITAYDERRFDEAAAGFARAVKRQGDQPWLRYRLVRTYVNQGDCVRAAEALGQLKEADPEYPRIPELESLVRRCR